MHDDSHNIDINAIKETARAAIKKKRAYCNKLLPSSCGFFATVKRNIY